MKKRITLTADEGKVITNGKRYGKIIYLWADEIPEDFYEIPEEEYNAIMAEKESIGGVE